jgi:hypothetical protein
MIEVKITLVNIEFARIFLVCFVRSDANGIMLGALRLRLANHVLWTDHSTTLAKHRQWTCKLKLGVREAVRFTGGDRNSTIYVER